MYDNRGGSIEQVVYLYLGRMASVAGEARLRLPRKRGWSNLELDLCSDRHPNLVGSDGLTSWLDMIFVDWIEDSSNMPA